jgi:hypothetical protein
MDSDVMVNQMYEDTTGNMRCHLTVIKWIGAVLIFVTCMAPLMVLVGISGSREKPDYEVKEIPSANQTGCVFVKQYRLGGTTYATVCNRNGELIVDIRKILNGTASIVGIPLELRQWLNLKRTTKLIDTAISEGRTYWNSLKRL